MKKINNIKNYFTAYNLLLTGSFLLIFFSILAPVLLKLGFTEPAKAIYFVYSFFCHQIHYRSLHIFDYQFAWCTRDTFIWTSIFISGVILKRVNINPIKWYYLILASIPMALDGGIQLIATMISVNLNESSVFYASTNFSRMVTGSILGLTLGLWMFSMMKTFEIPKTSQKKLSSLKVFTLGFLTSFVVYLIFIGAWALTSSSYRPANIIDWKNRFPESNEKWLIRREHAICPVDASNGQSLFSFKCEED